MLEKLLFGLYENDLSWVGGRAGTCTLISFTLLRMSHGSVSVRSATSSEMVALVVNSELRIVRSSA